MKFLIFSTHEIKYLWYLQKKVNVRFIFILFFFFFVKGENTLFPSHFSIILLGSVRLIGIILGALGMFAP